MTIPAELDVELTDACGQTPSFFCEAAWNLTHNRLLARAADWVVMKPILALVILGITALVNKWLRRLVTKLIVRFTNREQLAVSALSKIGVGTPSSLTVVDPRLARRTSTLTAVSRAVVSTLVWTVGILLVVGVFGIDLGPLLAGVGIAGIAVGLGAQSLVRDCIAGFFVIMEDQFGVGDEVDLGQAVGTVETITLRCTTVRGVDGTLWSVPNGSILRVGNQSKLWSKALLDITIWYDADIDRALELLKETAAEVCARPEVQPIVLEPPEVQGVERLTNEGVVLRVVVKTAPGRQWELMRDLRSAIKEAFYGSDIVMVRR
jgi:moderate conductance mechanosensitive channel